MMDVQKAIRQRRSVREFTGERVSDGDVRNIVDAARWAPSGLNNQPWRFMIVRGGEKDGLCEFTKCRGIIKGADAAVIVLLDESSCYDRTKDLQSVGACIQNMLLEAFALGLGAVWVGQILNEKEGVQRYLKTEYELMAVVALGWPKNNGEESDRKALSELIV